MSGIPDGPPTLSAEEIRRRAENLRRGLPANAEAEEKQGGPGHDLKFVAGVYLAVTACAAGFMMLIPSSGIPFHLPFGPDLNDLLFDAKPPPFFNNKIADFALAAAAKSAALCLAAAFFPFCTFMWNRMLDRAQANFYVSFWGVTIGVPFCWFFVKDFFGPLLLDVFDVIS
jgi:hypothetical protein